MPEQPSIIQQNAAWAQTFQGSTTNLARRNRYASQIAAAKDEDKREADFAFEQAQRRDPELGRLMLAREKEKRQANQAGVMQNFRERQFGFQQQRAAEQGAMAAKRFDLDLRKADVAERKAFRDRADADRVLAQTDALEQAAFDLREAGIMPGSPGYAAGIFAAAIDNPYAHPDLRRTILQDARIDADPDELLVEAQMLGMKNPKLVPQVLTDGRRTYRVSKGEEQAAADQDQEYLDAIKEWRKAADERANMDKGGTYSAEDRLMADRAKIAFAERVKKIEAARNAAPASDSAPTQKEPVAVNPKTGERAVFRNGQWQPLK